MALDLQSGVEAMHDNTTPHRISISVPNAFILNHFRLPCEQISVLQYTALLIGYYCRAIVATIPRSQDQDTERRGDEAASIIDGDQVLGD